MICEQTILNVGDTFTYEGVTYKAEKGKIVTLADGDTFAECEGCVFFTENFECMRKNDMPLCSEDWRTPIIFVKE